MGYYELLGQSEYDLLGQEYDLLGQGRVEIMGQDDLDLLGAVRARGARPSPRMANAMANRVAEQGVMVKTAAPTKSRTLYIPINTGAVGVGAAANVQLAPPQPVKVKEIRLDPVQCPNFQITGFAIGRMNQNMLAGAVGCTVFSAANPGEPVKFDTAQTAEPIVLGFLNVGGVIATLTGILIVETIE